MASLQTGARGRQAGRADHATHKPQTYGSVAGPILGSFTFRVTASIGDASRAGETATGRSGGDGTGNHVTQKAVKRF